MSSSIFVILAVVVALASSVSSNSTASRDGDQMMRARLNSIFGILSPRNAFPEECPPGSCRQLPVDPELASWNFDFTSMTENQLKAVCREAKAQATCFYQQENSCIPSDFRPLVEPLNNGLAKLFEICDKPSLYTDYQAIQTCAHTLIAQVSPIRQYSFLSSYTLTTLCPYASLIAGKSAFKELERVEAVAKRWSWKPYRYSDSDSTTTTTKAPSTVVVNATEFQHGACCAAKAVVECGLTTLVSETCSSEATAAIKRNLDHVLNSFNCPQVIASRPCPLAINLAK